MHVLLTEGRQAVEENLHDGVDVAAVAEVAEAGEGRSIEWL